MRNPGQNCNCIKETEERIRAELGAVLVQWELNVKPTIKPEIILSKLDIEASLKVAGNQHMLTHNYFQATAPAAIKLMETGAK